MKWMIASDIHGSEYYADKMLKAYKSEKATKLLLLGDLLYHGPRNDLPFGYNPKKVINILNDLNKELICVRGNCDAEVDQMVLDFPILTDHIILETEFFTIYMCHGHHENDERPPLMNNDYLLLCGHTHVPSIKVHDHYIYLNPGSISLPKNNSKHSYMIIEDYKLIWKSLDGDINYEYKYIRR